ncbi:MAG: PTS sugar transporter subunit IIA [Actinomycetota bacterium]
MSLLRSAFGPGAISIRQSVANRTEAITYCGQLLVESGRVSEGYVSSMLQAVEEFGPYIVIAPGIALAHGKPSRDVIETGLSLLVLEEPIEFMHSQNDPVRLVFGLAATGHDGHISLMSELAEFLSNDPKVSLLLNTRESWRIQELFD